MKPVDIFKNWDLGNICYCHWKSNEHLSAGLNGDTDLDVLVSDSEIEGARKILREGSCVKVVSRPNIRGIEDWICFDKETTKQYHIHLHTLIPLGGTKAKIFELKITDIILSSRTQEGGIWVIHPAQERLLLTLRILLKTKLRQIARVVLRGGVPYPENIKREIEWLAEKQTETDAAPPFLPSSIEKTIYQTWDKIQYDKLTIVYFVWLVLVVRLKLIGTIEVSRMFMSTHKRKKRLAKKGKVIAIVGVDGSGKSSVVDFVQEHLGWKISIQKIYLGLPKNTFIGQFLRRVVAKFPGGIKLFYVYAGIYRLLQSRKAHRLVSIGELVLTDRYPCPIFWEDTKYPIDGPRNKGGLMAKLENLFYKHIPEADSMIYLRAPLNVLENRDPTLSEDLRTEKFKIMERLVDKPSVTVVDATQTLEEVIHDVEVDIWNELCQL